MNLAGTALPLLLVSSLAVGCGSRSGLDCFGDTCQVGGSSSVGVAGGGGATGEDEDPPPVIIPPREPPGSGSPSPSRCGASSTFVGSVEVNAQSDLERLAGCVVVDGDLQINLFGDDLSALSELESVTGTLGLSLSGSLEGLENLDQVGNLSLVQLDVPSLRPLADLRTIGDTGRRGGRGDLTIQGLQRQRDLDGLGGIESVRRIMIAEAGSLESLDGLAVPAEVNSISVSGSPAIVDISALTPLQVVDGDLSLAYLGITTLTGLHNLEQASNVRLSNLPALSHIRALQNLPEVQTMEVQEVAVRQLDGLETLRSATNIIIISNPNLTNIGALASLERLSQLLISDNPQLRNVPNVPAVDRLQRVEIERNPLLPFIPLFPGVTEIEFLSVIDNASLLSLRGFSGLQRARSIDIRQNPTLEEVPLEALTSARELTISCNAALLESSIEPLRAVSDSASFSGNLGSSAPCDTTLE
jgi:hypothetical protein